MIIAQITDCHVAVPGRLVFGRVDTAARLRSAVASLNAMSPRPDVVVATGDLVETGSIEEYRHLRELLAPLTMPIYLIAGNHDDRAALRRVFADHGHYLPSHGFLHWAVDRHPVRLIGLDTVVPGQPNGELCAARINWLDSMLAQRAHVPTLLLMHHPPFFIGQDGLDNIRCYGAERLHTVIQRHPQVEALLCGHYHQALVTRWAGVTAVVAPATAHQIEVDAEGDGPPRWNLDPAACMIHVWRRGGGLISRVAVVEHYPGPFAYGRTPEPMANAAE
jgi:3',5'-cyclic AMP phosphodiesterase CpdA